MPRYAVETIGVEPGAPGPNGINGFDARVDTVLEGWWLMGVTLTTVGYGDYSPQTPTGRVIAAGAMYMGVVFVALPLAIVGDHFTQAPRTEVYTAHVRWHN